MPVTQPTLDAIAKAETALDMAKQADAQAANLIATAESASKAADDGKKSALAAHSAASQAANDAITALKAELGVSSPSARLVPSVKGAHPMVQQAVNLGIDYSKIIQILIQGGLQALENAIQAVLSGQVSAS